MRDVACGIVNKDNKVLMVKKAKDENLSWTFPGGKVEDGETNEQVCIREVYEETGLTVSIIESLGERIHPNTGVKVIYYLCQYESGKITILDKDEILEIAFKTKQEFIDDVKTDVYEPVKKYIMKNIA